jgi:hypothetical protein
MNEFLDKLADLMEEYDVTIYISGNVLDFCNKKDEIQHEYFEINNLDIRALKTKEDE